MTVTKQYILDLLERNWRVWSVKRIRIVSFDFLEVFSAGFLKFDSACLASYSYSGERTDFMEDSSAVGLSSSKMPSPKV